MGVTGADWAVLLAIVVVLFALDLLVATLRPHAVGFREATLWSLFFIAAAPRSMRGLPEVKHPGHPFYFMAPGGQAFTIAPLH